MVIELLYFAWVRERIGLDRETIEAPENTKTIAELVDMLSERSAGHAEAFADRTRLRAAIDQKFAQLDAPIAGAREIALFPPVTGG